MSHRFALMPQLRARFFLPLFTALLAGCATGGKAPALSDHADARARAQMTEWTAQGKIALRNATASESATLLWQQTAQRSELKLSGPLGMGTTHIASDGTKLHVKQGADLRVLDISTPEAIFLNTGWALPLQALPYWLKGVASPDFPVDAITWNDPSGTLATLYQDGWQITYDTHASFEGVTLPTRIVAERDDMRIKVILRTWRDLAVQ